MAKKRPIAEASISGFRVRCFTGRTEYTVIIGDKNFEDKDADAWEFPKAFGVDGSMHQAVMNHQNELRKKSEST